MVAPHGVGGFDSRPALSSPIFPTYLTTQAPEPITMPQNMTPAAKSAHTRKVRANLAAIDAKATAKGKTSERLWAFDRLRKLCPAGSTVLVTLDHVSRSGMSRKINAHVIVGRGKSADVQYVAGLMANAFPDRFSRRAGDDALTVGGCGMDMGFAVVYDLAQCLYGDGYALSHRWM